MYDIFFYDNALVEYGLHVNYLTSCVCKSICYLACEFGFYGDQCTQECGNCHNQTNCRHTNGSCASGCDVGFHGDLCKTGKCFEN